MTGTQQNWLRLEGQNTTFIMRLEGGLASVVYWGEKLAHTDTAAAIQLLTRQAVQGTPSIELPVAMCPVKGSGYSGMEGVQLHRGGFAWDFNPRTIELEKTSEDHATIHLADPVNNILLTHNIRIDINSDVLTFDATVTNRSTERLILDCCCAATLPLPPAIDRLTGFHGRWAGEFQTQVIEQFTGAYVRENLRGRTSHESFPGLLAHAHATSETDGPAYGFHLGWSGNHRIVSEKLTDGRSMVQMGERLLAGEIILEANETYQTPPLYASFSPDGFSALSGNFHRFVRANLIDSAVKSKPRPIHYNTWEAVYFNHDTEKLKLLADKAADVGAERFVLDDGWFNGRRDDSTGLGDWYVDKEVYPDGLTPLVDHVLSLGMEFGLWVEPEMVNPDSDLYRAHPDWVLGPAAAEQLPFRNQLVLDLTKGDVQDYLFERLDSLLSTYRISYLKWDMNRDINHPGSRGRPAVHKQTLGLYNLISHLRTKHPGVEIESCASGGARADYGILEHTDRIWTSDSNDALDRLEIQRGMSFFFPSEVMGAHIGPRECHITRRMLSMELRAATAFFGHMGMELDLTELTEQEENTLKSVLRLHKQHRHLIHSGALVRPDSKPHARAFGIVADSKSEALFSYTQTQSRTDTTPETLKFENLSPADMYRINLIWPERPQGGIIGSLDHFADKVFPGEALMKVGLQLPQIVPETALLFHLRQIES